MEEDLLPEHILSRASISSGGEHAWKMEDIPEVIAAAREAGLANLGGQPQFRGLFGTAELFWLGFSPVERKPNESWQSYVDRSASETLAAFREIVSSTDFQREGCENWIPIKEAKDKGVKLSEHLWFVLYFEKYD